MDVPDFAKDRARAHAPALLIAETYGFEIVELRWVKPNYWLDPETPVRFEGVGS